MWQVLLRSLNIIKINWQVRVLKNSRNYFLTKYTDYLDLVASKTLSGITTNVSSENKTVYVMYG